MNIKPFFMNECGSLYNGDAFTVLSSLPGKSVQCCVTSPPYWGLRDYGINGQIGLEETPQKHIEKLLHVFKEVHRVLKDNGTLWLNYGDSYSYSGDKSKWSAHGKQARNKGSLCMTLKQDKALPPKNLLGLPWKLAFALQEQGWFLRADIIWNKTNAMPESCKDRPTRSHEYLFLLSKSSKYYYDFEAMQEPVAALSNEYSRKQNQKSLSFAREVNEPERPGQSKSQHRIERSIKKNSMTRNRRTVWNIPTARCKDAHFATFPSKLAEICMLAGSRKDDSILDPFMGSGTTALVAENQERKWLGVELNIDYCNIVVKRLKKKFSLLSLKDAVNA